MQPLPFVSGHLLFRRASISSTHPCTGSPVTHTKYIASCRCIVFHSFLVAFYWWHLSLLHILSLVCSGTTCSCVGAWRPIYIFSASQASQCYRPSETGEEDDMLGKFVGKAVGDHWDSRCGLLVNTRWYHYFETVGGNPYLTPIWSEWAIQRPIRLYISMLWLILVSKSDGRRIRLKNQIVHLLLTWLKNWYCQLY